MSNKRAPGRSLDEWMELVTECRQSGLTDAAWCNEHGISPSCFYNAVTRLRKKGKRSIASTYKKYEPPDGSPGYQFLRIPSGKFGDHGNKSSRKDRSVSSICFGISSKRYTK